MWRGEGARKEGDQELMVCGCPEMDNNLPLIFLPFFYLCYFPFIYFFFTERAVGVASCIYSLRVVLSVGVTGNGSCSISTPTYRLEATYPSLSV